MGDGLLQGGAFLLEVEVYQVGDDFGVRLALEGVSFGLEVFFEGYVSADFF